ncbi:MAG: chromosome segregation protein SMC [Acidobacteria bacterium]|jgi:hypothetical protein|nr:MAG: chromosome segregation protein SMC [Acidobacteriota bacterium]
MARKRKERKEVKTTVILPYELWLELRTESVKKRISMSELIAKRLAEWKELKEKSTIYPFEF